MTIVQFQLDNGIPVLFERLPHLHSVTIGVWVLVGSRHEGERVQGISHLVEHMLFKGTRKRNALEIAEALEFVGGEINAFTCREYSCYWAKAPSDHFGLAADVLSDLVVDSQFDAGEFVKERKVILEEIKMYEDNPEDLCMDLLSRSVFDSSLGHPIVGTSGIVKGIPRDAVYDYYRRMYGPKDMFVTIVGNVTEQVVRREIARFRWPDGRRHARVKPFPGGEFRNAVRVDGKKTEQAHVAVAFGGLPIAHRDRYLVHLVNAHLGGGMSSVLFQEVREKRGLAYSVNSFMQAYRDIGLFGIYCGMSAGKAREVLAVVRQVLQRLIDSGMTAERLARMKEQIKGNLLLSLEKPSFRMTRLGINHLYFDRMIPVEEVVEMIDAIRPEQVHDLSRRLFGPGYLAATGVGAFTRRDVVAGLGTRPGQPFASQAGPRARP
jgi:predicted Zn-dependent peptidase